MVSRLVVLALAAASLGLGQLTVEQKLADFQHLAALFAKQYAPYGWKLTVQRFDLLEARPWLDRIPATQDDLEFYELMIEYVSRLRDAHSIYTLPSGFSANLNFTVDLYEGKVLIDSINRARLPAADYPFQIGDELVALDGRDVESLMDEFTRYADGPNPRGARRAAAGRLTARPQSRMPRAIETGERAAVLIRRASGELETYSLPWTRNGLPMTGVGPVPSPAGRKPGGIRSAAAMPDYLEPLLELQNCALPDSPAVLGQGSRFPVFAMPPGFAQRLGRSPSDDFFSGTFQAAGYRIGFLRIPNFAPANQASALAQFRREILYFEENTDGLVIDQMRNSGGQVGYANSLLAYLIPYPFQALGFEIRATSSWIARFSNSLESARARGADSWIVETLAAILADLQKANRENRGLTGALPIDNVSLVRNPARGSAGELEAYTKPLIVLVDEFSGSAGDLFPATLQDNQRGAIVGFRTMGAGGSVATSSVGAYSEGSAGITQALMVRRYPVITAEYPAAPYVEEIGVRPDIEADIMTRENLLNGGRRFVGAFTEAIVSQIRAGGVNP